MQSKKVSVIVPIYNVEKYIGKCVDSIRNQDYPNIEIILVDDGSPDKSPQIIDEMASNDDRIKVIHEKMVVSHLHETEVLRLQRESTLCL